MSPQNNNDDTFINKIFVSNTGCTLKETLIHLDYDCDEDKIFSKATPLYLTLC